MKTTTTCDRCGEEILGAVCELARKNSKWERTTAERYNLCLLCASKLRKWFAGPHCRKPEQVDTTCYACGNPISGSEDGLVLQGGPLCFDCIRKAAEKAQKTAPTCTQIEKPQKDTP